MLRRYAVIWTILLVVLLAGGTSASASNEGRTTTCPLLKGKPWQLPYAPYTKGSTYDVSLLGSKYSCKQADSWIAKLVTHKVSKGLPPLVAGGPSGLRCTGSADKQGFAYTGQCSKPTSFTGPGFVWSVG